MSIDIHTVFFSTLLTLFTVFICAQHIIFSFGLLPFIIFPSHKQMSIPCKNEWGGSAKHFTNDGKKCFSLLPIESDRNEQHQEQLHDRHCNVYTKKTRLNTSSLRMNGWRKRKWHEKMRMQYECLTLFHFRWKFSVLSMLTWYSFAAF